MDPFFTPRDLQRYTSQVMEAVGIDGDMAEHYKWELDHLESLIQTGTSRKLELYMLPDNTLMVHGKHFDGGSVMFLLDSEKITVQNERSKHLVPLLRRLAEREGLTLNLVDEYTDIPEGIKVAFWKFNNREEVDDSKIVLKAQPRLPEDEPEAIAYVQYSSYTTASAATLFWDESGPF